MTRSVVLRPLRRANLAGVGTLIDSTGLFSSQMLTEMTAGYLTGGVAGGRWWVLDAGEVLAVAYCAPERMADNAWDMLLLAVHADHHGRGLGRFAVAAVEHELLHAGDRLLLAQTSGLPEFAHTRAFHRACGYREEARIRDYYRAGEDRIVYTKPLARSTGE